MLALQGKLHLRHFLGALGGFRDDLQFVLYCLFAAAHWPDELGCEGLESLSVEFEVVAEAVDGHNGCCCILELRDYDEALLLLLGVGCLGLIAALERDGVGLAHSGEYLERVELPEEALVSLRSLGADGQRRGLVLVDELECFNVAGHQ